MKSKLHPGVRWVFRIRCYSSFIFIFIFLGFLLFSIIAPLLKSSYSNSVSSIVTLTIAILVILLIIIILLGEIYARMSYNRWFYEIGHDNIRLERGIIWKRYSNIPYERVQNVDIHRGIIARICGFSSLLIQTAGYSAPMRGGYGGGVEGYIPAVEVEHAEQIREYVLKRIKGKHQGL